MLLGSDKHPPPRPRAHSLFVLSGPHESLRKSLGVRKISGQGEDSQTEQWTLVSLAGRGDRQGGARVTGAPSGAGVGKG